MTTNMFFVVSPLTSRPVIKEAFTKAEANGYNPVLVYDRYGDKPALNLTHLRMEEDKLSAGVAFSLKAVNKEVLAKLELDSEFIHEYGVRAHTWCFDNDPLVENNREFLEEALKSLEDGGFIRSNGKIGSCKKGDKSFKLPAFEVGTGFAAFLLNDIVSENDNGFYLETQLHFFSKDVKLVPFHKSNQIEFLKGM